MSEPLLSLIRSIWDHVNKDEKFYVIIEARDHFYIEDPDEIEQGEWAQDEQKEAGVMVFTARESADHYREYLVEERGVQPSTLTTGALPLSRLYALLPKINKYTQKKYGHPVRIQAVHYSLNKEYAFSEILHSSLMWRH